MAQARYVTDETGKRVAVLLDIEEYERILKELEELDDIRAYDEAMSGGEEPVPWEKALGDIAEERKQLKAKGLVQ